MNGGNISGGTSGGTSGGKKIIPGPRPKMGKDQRDEDLVLFREMFKQERASAISLLQPDSVEFEPNGNYQFYRQASARRGYEFLPDSGKSDYDWLKTPPATPLFASLEMDSGINAPEFAVQRELPILQPLSRFSGNPKLEEKSSSTEKYKSHKPKPITEDLLMVPNVNLRPIRTTVTTPPEPKPRTTKFKNPTTSITQKTNPQTSTINKRTSSTSTITKVSAKPTNIQQQQPKKQESSNMNFLATKLSKTMQHSPVEPKTSKPKSRGVSPLVRNTINFTGISNETPPNLKTDQDKSVNRTRRTDTTPLKRENNNLKTQPRSSSVSSFCSVEPKIEVNKSNSTQVLGSRMVDRFMSTRRSSTTTTTTKIVEEKETRTKPINMRASLNEGSGFGRRVSKS